MNAHVDPAPLVARVTERACPRCNCYGVHDDACGCGAVRWSTCANCGRDTGRAPEDLEGGLASYARCDAGAVPHEHLLPITVRLGVEQELRPRGRGGYVFTVAGDG